MKTSIEDWEWDAGNPPHTGWFNAVVNFVDNFDAHRVWRYYDKDYDVWSGPAWENDSGDTVARLVKHTISKRPPSIYWRWHWPKNARVARINHETGICTGAGPSPYSKKYMILGDCV